MVANCKDDNAIIGRLVILLAEIPTPKVSFSLEVAHPSISYKVPFTNGRTSVY